MPQYDVYEDPPSLSRSPPLGEGHNDAQTLKSSPVIPVSLRRLDSPIAGPGISAKDEGIYHIPSPDKDRFHTAMSAHTHARHSALVRDESASHLIPMTLTHPVALDPSPKSLNAEERASLAEYTKAQADNESIRLALACELCGDNLNDKNQVNDPLEFAKEAHMLNGGWMHRSRASCELLIDRPAGETWETRDVQTRDVEALRARPRGAL